MRLTFPLLARIDQGCSLRDDSQASGSKIPAEGSHVSFRAGGRGVGGGSLLIWDKHHFTHLFVLINITPPAPSPTPRTCKCPEKTFFKDAPERSSFPLLCLPGSSL